VVGVNLAVALCPTDTLAGTLLSRVRQVVSSRRGLMIEGVATLRGEGIRYRAVLPPLSEDGATIACQTASNRDPRSASKRDPSPALGQACPGSEQEGPARVAQCPHERRSGARGRCLFAHRGKPGWHSGAVFEAPALVAGFDDFAVMGQTVEKRGCHLGVAKHTGPIAKGQVGRDDDRSALI